MIFHADLFVRGNCFTKTILPLRGVGFKIPKLPKNFYWTVLTETGELVKIFNNLLGDIRAAESSQGKTVPFTLIKEGCQAIAAKYFKLITGEQLPNVGGLLENTWPRPNSLIRPSDNVSLIYPRVHKGYQFYRDFVRLCKSFLIE